MCDRMEKPTKIDKPNAPQPRILRVVRNAVADTLVFRVRRIFKLDIFLVCMCMLLWLLLLLLLLDIASFESDCIPGDTSHHNARVVFDPT
jgi:hypothetical protein